jgi:tetratricopeptide (TPR) repeat protein
VEQIDSLLGVMRSLPPQSGYDPNLRGVYAALELIAHGYPEAGRRVMEEEVADLAGSSDGNRARIYYWSGQYAEAVELYETLLESAPESVQYLWHYGASLARLGREEEARRVIDRLGAIEQRNLRAYNTWGQGLITAILGDRDEAVRLFQDAFANGRAYDIWVHREPALADMWGYGPFDALMAPR